MAAGIMVMVLLLHVVRVYLTGGFKKPRELIWVTGIILAVVTLTFGLTGYYYLGIKLVIGGVKLLRLLQKP